MKTLLISTYLIFLLIGATTFWYFRHLRPDQEILKTELKKVYLGTLPTQKDERDMEFPTAVEDMTTDSSPESTDTKVHSQHAMSSDAAMSNEGTVTPSEQPDSQHCHSHEADPEAAAKLEAEQSRLEAAQLELFLAEEHLKVARAESEPKIISHVNLLNAMSPEEQRKYWENYRTFLVNDVIPLLSDEDTGFDPDEVIQTFRDGLIQYGYQPQY